MSQFPQNNASPFLKLTSDETTTKISFSAPEISQIFPLIKKDQYFSKDQKILKYSLKPPDPSQTPRCFYYQAPFYGKLLKYSLDEKELILEKCMHDTFYFNLCIKCNFDKSTVKSGYIQTAKNYASIHPDLTFSLDKAKQEEKNIVHQYLSEKKLILLLDLDNTILHTCSIPLSEDEITSLKNQYNDYIGKIGLKKEYGPFSYDKIIVKFRPHLKEFLSLISDKYQIYTYTHGTKSYATGIIQYINSKLGKNALSIDRLIARENNIIESKTIKKVFPTTDNIVVILDDRRGVWAETSENLINLYPYYFFYDRCMHEIQGKYVANDDDNVLYSVMHILNYVHGEFYDHYSKFQIRKHVKTIIKEKMYSIFRGMSFVCSNLFKKEETNDEVEFKKLINSFGGEYYKELNDTIDCLLVGEFQKTDKVMTFVKEKKMILHESFIDCCHRMFYKVDWEPFLITEEKKKMSFVDLGKIFEKYKDLIKDFYKVKVSENEMETNENDKDDDDDDKKCENVHSNNDNSK